MKVNHHLDDATLLRYASGDLDEAFLTVVATHLAMCENCRAAAHAVEQVGGQLLQSGEAEPVSDEAFDDLMRMIDAGEDSIDVSGVPERKAAVIAGDVPLPLQRFIGPSLDDVKWRTVAPGVRKYDIKLDRDAASLYMLHIAPGMKMPEHGHGGSEITLILSGAYRDDLGEFGPGDVADLDQHVEHQPQVISDEPCVCLVAMESPTRFKGILAKLMQPFIGI